MQTQEQIAKAKLNRKLREAIIEFETATGYLVLAIDVDKTRASKDDAITTKEEEN